MMLQIVGCSHHDSGMIVREKLAFDQQQVGRFLTNFYNTYPQSEALLLSTCNRTEFFTATHDQSNGPSFAEMQQSLADACGLENSEVKSHVFELSNQDAIRHLFSVAASLDSMVIGETQILQQVKQAYDLATQINNNIPLTHHVFQAAIKVAKRVANQTEIQQNRVSIPSIAIGDFARQIVERLDNKNILVIGAGEMAEETLQYVTHYGGKHIRLVNRTREKAVELANRWSGDVVEWSELMQALDEADLIISTTGAQEAIVSIDQYRQTEDRRGQKPLFILDLAVPRDFDPAIGECENVYLYSLDDLQAQCEHNQKSRRSHWPKAKKIIDQETELFMKELAYRSKGSAIALLKASASEIKDAELRRLINKLGPIEPRHRDEIETAFHRLTNKLLHPPLESLREESDVDSDHSLFEAFKKLFRLGD